MIRESTHEDLAQLLLLYRHLHKQDAEATVEAVGSAWKDIQSSPLIHCFVKEENRILVSSCTLILVPNLTRAACPFGLIENVVTHAKHRKKGYATTVLKHAIQFAFDNRAYKVMLMTGSTNPATHSFYRSVGFEGGNKTAYVINNPVGFLRFP